MSDTNSHREPDLADIKLGASTSFTAREVDVMHELFRSLLKSGDVRVLLRNPELVKVARKFQRMRDTIEVVAFLLAVGALVPVSHAQERMCPEAPRSLILARLTWHEAGVDALADATAIFESLTGLARVRGETWEEAACSYSGRALRGETRRSWISRLEGPAAAPLGWPDGASWDVHRRLLDRLLDHADRVVAGDVAPVCSALPTDWGHPTLDSHRIERGIARGYWRRVNCAGVRGVYLRRGELDRIDSEDLELAGGR
jgi:hypothetical protein